ncbi:MAG: aminoacyl-tRNA hydrolase [SAR86 cluster bacterium]|uniref:Peptidyl-tRNA hydrolase n=1 Tax=SAR86 cluster bacterium TaxID=2030880 RepID=A0A2A5CFT9_9GAMM|nr:aminoacyl-tRNA hydrolase [Gammaproteobacteria bacterium AH-315-E17]PCJ42632.1 MAG: aminoacyl-tRNA hydrolase [SAR86 cluster bacterium]
MSGIKLIVGLGNPGPQYRFTRHNAGAMFLESLCDDYKGELKAETKFFGMSGRVNINGEDVRLLFPATFMNKSGQSVAALVNYFKIEPLEILIAYDELDLPVGTTRLKKGGGHGGHNGIRDIIKAIGSQDFNRLRIGIGHPGEASKVSNYVLGEPSKTDANQIQADIDKSISILPLLVKGEFQDAMLRLHTKPGSE